VPKEAHKRILLKTQITQNVKCNAKIRKRKKDTFHRSKGQKEKIRKNKIRARKKLFLVWLT